VSSTTSTPADATNAAAVDAAATAAASADVVAADAASIDVTNDVLADASDEQRRFATALQNMLSPAVEACDAHMRSVLDSQAALGVQVDSMLQRLEPFVNGGNGGGGGGGGGGGDGDTAGKKGEQNANNNTGVGVGGADPDLRAYANKLADAQKRLKRINANVERIGHRMTTVRGSVRDSGLLRDKTQVSALESSS
jgi:hypothetical protein